MLTVFVANNKTSHRPDYHVLGHLREGPPIWTIYCNLNALLSPRQLVCHVMNMAILIKLRIWADLAELWVFVSVGVSDVALYIHHHHILDSEYVLRLEMGFL